MAQTFADLNRTGMSQTEVAEELGCTRQWVQQVERGALRKLQLAAEGRGPPERVEAMRELKRLMAEEFAVPSRLYRKGGVWRQAT